MFPIKGKKKVAIIAGSSKTAAAITNQLVVLFGAFIDFYGFSQKSWNNDSDYDMVLISTQTIFTRELAPKIKPGTVILIIRRTLLRTSWEKVMSIPVGTKLLMVNDEKDSAEETIALLRELGAGHIELVPYYPEIQDCPPYTSAITPGEGQLAPDIVNRVIDIGERVIDVSTLVDILTQFNLLHSDARDILSVYSESIITRSQGIQMTMRGLIHAKLLLQQTLDMVQDGVIAYDLNGKITFFNTAAQALFECTVQETNQLSVKSLFERVRIDLDVMTEEFNDSLFQIKKHKVLASRQVIEENGHFTGGVLTLKAARHVEEQELKLRLHSKGYQAKFSFADLVTTSIRMKRVVEQAEKMASSDLAVLILGESGTGKELFAHAIHQASTRSSFPFVAVNCSSLPDNLLESELFGYEEGAFTGARKGGKPGLFEQAHKGTIFLDEIGDISPNLQSRLLRVLQQKEVLKVGGTRLLPVDVRVIAATNRDLTRMVNEGAFRADLYYRLKVLQLLIPPLRERKEDIPLLSAHFLRRRGADEKLLVTLLASLVKHDWHGNVRELENAMEYVAFMNDHNLSANDIPGLEVDLGVEKVLVQSNEIPPQLYRAAPNNERFLLNLIYLAKTSGKNAGRRSLVEQARQNGVVIHETEVRKIVEKLRTEGWIEVSTGRGGITLTESGYLLCCSNTETWKLGETGGTGGMGG
ncbi:sigma-54 interaction domain-containing protein [Brevibacillus choshinensis]|uniref:sigma-54 interaction domain-containing protein n=3 Tax=Brevibacillus choshinensis TaxID=54911 RepID=UPI002E21E2FD|nr:sigma 54-interacting transcriptional regulator [Brevibacillus choshinensis]MED4581209.1 sigma 54-interacting transcriptional regulator [Brevibacillus choshinensis]MED4750865.1 sigma 54-interacting transcriptional regulator [Brevibacillus choshinensis]